MDLLCTFFVIVNWREHEQITNVNGYNICSIDVLKIH
jgi:hypothetical protein